MSGGERAVLQAASGVLLLLDGESRDCTDGHNCAEHKDVFGCVAAVCVSSEGIAYIQSKDLWRGIKAER